MISGFWAACSRRETPSWLLFDLDWLEDVPHFAFVAVATSLGFRSHVGGVLAVHAVQILASHPLGFDCFDLKGVRVRPVYC